jgi:hypothetical protein
MALVLPDPIPPDDLLPDRLTLSRTFKEQTTRRGYETGTSARARTGTAGIAVCCGSMCRVTPCALNESTTFRIQAGSGASL